LLSFFLVSVLEPSEEEEVDDDESDFEDDDSDDEDEESDDEDEDELVSFSLSLGLSDPVFPPRLSVL